MLDALGGDICAGRLTPGSVLTLQRIEERFGVSRSVGRETIRVLDSMRLVVSRRRVGVVVLPPDEWNLFDPRVVHWRLQAPDRDAQIAALAELRIAVEPEAARLAATRATSAEVAELVSIAGRMWAAGEDEDRERFHELDLGFHSLVLVASRNGMFSRLESVISDTLTGRREHGLGPDQPLPVSLGLHAEVSAAIQRRDPTVSFSSMRRLLLQSVAESMPHRGDRRS
ncbi:FadR/GntR family transcriptional regulator [Rathayibacter oskolensis]|uniref:FadR/GntR family transcriptional regulator n=1 Tax=Rathayibacter oskolensis TaxID=1891671 RepID=UPI001AD825D9|nr:FCD domain-containing protein [Rathayibacter oskolensis]